MNIMILGATSILGQFLVTAFAEQNVLILVGRDTAKLDFLMKEAEKHNAENIIVIEHNLGKGVGDLLKEIKNHRVDLLINAASATSKFASRA